MRSKSANKKSASVGPKIIEGLREFTEALENDEPIVQRFTCRTVMLDMVPAVNNPRTVKATRKLLGTSQAIFAQFLGVSVNAVRAWEQGANTPSDMACRFMDEIRRNLQYWRNRLRESVTVRPM